MWHGPQVAAYYAYAAVHWIRREGVTKMVAWCWPPGELQPTQVAQAIWSTALNRNWQLLHICVCVCVSKFICIVKSNKPFAHSKRENVLPTAANGTNCCQLSCCQLVAQCGLTSQWTLTNLWAMKSSKAPVVVVAVFIVVVNMLFIAAQLLLQWLCCCYCC